MPLAVIVGLIFHTGTGTPSSFGWEAIAYVCPLGVFETFLASWLLIPRAVVALVVCVIVVIILGKVFCAWVCPVPPLRRFFTFKKNKPKLTASETAAKTVATEDSSSPEVSPSPKTSPTLEVSPSPDASSTLEAAQEKPQSHACPSGCTSCAEKRKKLDSRHVVLGGALVSTAVFGFPVFCIVCPVGLSFATIIAFWRLVGFNEPSWALLIFPLFLALELLVLKKWCLKICPLGALMSLMSIPNKLLRPRVEKETCLRTQGIACDICVSVCEEQLDPHFSDGMHECTKCGLCKDSCPTQSISFTSRKRKLMQ